MYWVPTHTVASRLERSRVFPTERASCGAGGAWSAGCADGVAEAWRTVEAGRVDPRALEEFGFYPENSGESPRILSRGSEDLIAEVMITQDPNRVNALEMREQRG